jgi:hypothetical protein
MTDIDRTVPPSGTGCVECDAASPQGWWLHLRRCATCGHIGCCDDSLARHASAHYRETEHSIIQSFEPGEDWFYDYRSDQTGDGPPLDPPRHHPTSQPTPGPAGKVPRDWMQYLH